MNKTEKRNRSKSSRLASLLPDNRVSLAYNTFRTNFESVVTALPALLLITLCKLLVDFIVSRGHPFDDRHGASCSFCLALVEIAVLILHGKKEFFRKRLLCTPILLILAVGISGWGFNFRPGLYQSLILTFSWWVSVSCHYFFDGESTDSPLKFLLNSLKIAISCHLLVVIYIGMLIIPARRLADKELMMLLFTGILVPLSAFMVRIVTSKICFEYVDYKGEA
jgi:hypothetical protein